MKRILSLTSILLLVILLWPINTKADSNRSIQQLIDDAKPGDTITIREGIYIENIVIDKAVKIVGENATIQNNSADPIFSIQSDGVVLENFHLQYGSTDNQQPAILIQGAKNKVTNVTIETNSYGIRLDEADYNEIAKVTITGQKEKPINQRRPGIDLWVSNHNHLHHNKITNVEDGIYIESSTDNIVQHNIITDSRYGYHLMFTKNTVLEQNESYENISGMMVMGTNKTKVHDNIIKYNQSNVQSLGLLLFDERDTTVTNNEIAHNRIGILLESSKHNTIASNKVDNNYIGIQFKQAENNTITNNVFSANVVQGQAETSTNNEMNQNYWGDHIGLDTTGNNRSDLKYEMNPFYLHLTSEYPPYRIFFASPGMLFLEKLIHTPDEERLVDLSPLMENPFISHSEEDEQDVDVLLMSSIFLTLSIVIFIMGVMRK